MVPYDQFKDEEFIAEGDFNKVYKATWIDDSISGQKSYARQHNNNSLNQVIFYAS